MDKKLNKLAGYRSMLSLSQREFSKIIGITPQSYSNKERGHRPFNDLEKIKIKEFLSKEISEMTIDEIFFGN